MKWGSHQNGSLFPQWEFDLMIRTPNRSEHQTQKICSTQEVLGFVLKTVHGFHCRICRWKFYLWIPSSMFKAGMCYDDWIPDSTSVLLLFHLSLLSLKTWYQPQRNFINLQSSQEVSICFLHMCAINHMMMGFKFVERKIWDYFFWWQMVGCEKSQS